MKFSWVRKNLSCRLQKKEKINREKELKTSKKEEEKSKWKNFFFARSISVWKIIQIRLLSPPRSHSLLSCDTKKKMKNFLRSKFKRNFHEWNFHNFQLFFTTWISCSLFFFLPAPLHSSWINFFYCHTSHHPCIIIFFDELTHGGNFSSLENEAAGIHTHKMYNVWKCQMADC